MICFREWLIQFKEEEGDLGSVGATIYQDTLDMCEFPETFTSLYSLNRWLIDNEFCNYDMQLKILNSFKQYKKSIQGESEIETT